MSPLFVNCALGHNWLIIIHKYMSLIMFFVVASVLAHKTLNPVLTLVSTIILIAISRFVRMFVDVPLLTTHY